jgi:hypothetical protein
VLAYTEAHGPQVVAVEGPFFTPRRWITRLNVIVGALRERSSDLGIRVVQVSLHEVRQRLVGDPSASKPQVPPRWSSGSRGSPTSSRRNPSGGGWGCSRGTSTGCTCLVRWGGDHEFRD